MVRILACFLLGFLVLVGISSAGGPKLAGAVGPGFTITLNGPDGQSVTELDPGPFELSVDDLGDRHNFHLKGPGVDVATTIAGVGKQTFQLSLETGTYTFVCDQHASQMHGQFTVRTGGTTETTPPPTTVTVTPAAVDAVDDTGSSVNGATGGTSVTNVLANDTFNGDPATVATVTLAQVSTENAGVTLDTATGAVSAAAGTAAGSYGLVYEICESSNPANCDAATVTVTVTVKVTTSPAAPSAPVGARLVLTTGPRLSITLQTLTGKKVTALQPGRYTIVVRDRSTAHNARLLGAGANQSTTVPFTGTKTWKVTLRKGTLTFRCDAHKSTMRGTVTIG